MRHDLTNKLEDYLKAELINDKQALEKAMAIIKDIREDFASFDDEIPPIVHETVIYNLCFLLAI